MKLSLKQVCVRRRGRALLEDVDLRVDSGDLLALLGPNGAGKTTLLRVILGLLEPDAGKVLLDGVELSRLAVRERAARVAWLPQLAISPDELCALDVVASARYRFDEPVAVSEREAARALARVGVAHAAERPLATLSGGERQRVSLAGLLAQDSPLLLVDEPANHLDPAQQIEVYQLLGELWREGRSLVCVTHDVNLLRHLGEPSRIRVAGFASGRLAFERPFSDPDLAAALGSLFGVRMHSFELGAGRVLVPEQAR